jgi:hypothetical protein
VTGREPPQVCSQILQADKGQIETTISIEEVFGDLDQSRAVKPFDVKNDVVGVRVRFDAESRAGKGHRNRLENMAEQSHSSRIIRFEIINRHDIDVRGERSRSRVLNVEGVHYLQDCPNGTITKCGLRRMA